MKHLFALLCVLSCHFLTIAQSTDAVFTGIIKDETTGEVLSGATIRATNTTTGFAAATVTNGKGEFLLKDMQLGGPYTLQINYIGYQPLLLRGYQLNLGDRVDIRSVSLKRGENVLQEVVVQPNSFANRKDRLGAGFAVTGKDIQRLPTTTRNYTELAALSPLTKGTSIGGAKGGGTGYLLDGVTNRRTVFGEPVGGAFPVSLETVREFEILSNSYDVTNGRGSGGVIKAVTKSGTNSFHGAAWGFYSGNKLTGNKDINGKTIRNDYTVAQYGASFSGPIIKNKLHFFVNFDHYENTAPYRAFDFDFEGGTLEEAEKNLSITKTNLDQVVSILENEYGVPKVQQYGEISTKVVTNTMFAKLDYKLNGRNTLTFRYNYQSFDDPRKKKANGILSNQYKGYEQDHSFLLSLRSQLTSTAYNDLKVSIIDNVRENRLIYARSPEGEVEVASTLTDGSTVKRSVDFGNQNWVPEVIASTSYQLVNNIGFRTGKYNLTFGTDNIFTQIRDKLTHNQQGKFYYRSIQDLDNNTPWRFERKIPIGDRGGPVKPQVLETSLYGQVETNLLPNLNIAAGLRWDATLLPEKPAYNALLEQELGIRNDVAPFDADNIQPRLNITWDINNNNKHIIKAGAGWFASQFTTQAFTMAHLDNGINFVTIDARGADVPEAKWQDYYSDFNTVPGEDYLESLNLPVPPAAVLLLDKNLETPMTFKANISYHTYITNWLRVGVGLYHNRINDNFIYQNINVKKDPAFLLASEANREIYVPESTINGKDRADYLNARRSDKFTTVLLYTNADWATTYNAIVLEAAARIKDGSFSLSYTHGKTKGGVDYNSGNAIDSRRVGNSYWNYGPDARNWYADEDMRHKIVASFISPTFYGFNISSTFMIYQWNRFRATINQDINGDRNNTDLAYIFDPNDPNTPADIRDGMLSLLEKTSPEFRDYLESNFGKIAPDNGGLMPWRHSWNMSVSKEFRIKGEQKIQLRADFFNMLNLFNHEWGGFEEIINTTLYNVKKYDSATKRYEYSVNQNAGTKRKSGTPFNLQVGIKYLF